MFNLEEGGFQKKGREGQPAGGQPTEKITEIKKTIEEIKKKLKELEETPSWFHGGGSADTVRKSNEIAVLLKYVLSTINQCPKEERDQFKEDIKDICDAIEEISQSGKTLSLELINIRDELKRLLEENQ